MAYARMPPAVRYMMPSLTSGVALASRLLRAVLEHPFRNQAPDIVAIDLLQLREPSPGVVPVVAEPVRRIPIALLDGLAACRGKGEDGEDGKARRDASALDLQQGTGPQ